eukprot:TRINITY_DN5380_c0_g1_i2.p1 TRINITY_DN5380_c0_g1~~TRINITY_DN5380_c0_g1_i2.p1  ORF type:complete len:172 (-),score=13.56 TRINITY_DN5380_c0_g1_i2:20-511(-)
MGPEVQNQAQLLWNYWEQHQPDVIVIDQLELHSHSFDVLRSLKKRGVKLVASIPTHMAALIQTSEFDQLVSSTPPPFQKMSPLFDICLEHLSSRMNLNEWKCEEMTEWAIYHSHALFKLVESRPAEREVRTLVRNYPVHYHGYSSMRSNIQKWPELGKKKIHH